MMITKYVAKIPYEELINWNESIEKHIEIICEQEEEAIQIFRNLITNNFIFSERTIEGHFYIIKRSIDIENFLVQDIELYYAFIHNRKIYDVGNKNKIVHLEEFSSSYYKVFFYEYQEKINKIININNGVPSIEDTNNVINFCNAAHKMSIYFDDYNKMKIKESEYEKIKWW